MVNSELDLKKKKFFGLQVVPIEVAAVYEYYCFGPVWYLSEAKNLWARREAYRYITTRFH